MSSPTDMIRQLEWESLEQCHRKARLTMLNKSQHGLVAVHLPAIATYGTEAETRIPPPIPNKLLQDRLIQNQFFPTCSKAVEHTPTIHRF